MRDSRLHDNAASPHHPRVFIGIDPGVKGCVAVMNEGGDIIEVRKIGTTKELFDYLSELNISFVMVEKQFPISKQGLSSTATTLKNYGRVLAVLEVLEVPFQEVHPSTWKKEFSLVGKPKTHSVTVARHLHPRIDIKRHDEADAILLAEFAFRKRLGSS